jgi:2-polyprenyl-3-methyl-5-hydroxy-6-metoxy-1,4-benzoquinol methylase
MNSLTQRVREKIRTTKSNTARWMAESPSTRNVHLIWYQFKKQGLRRLFSSRYDDLFFEDQRYLQPAYKELADIIFEQFQPASVCDFGCGHGFLLCSLAEKGIPVSGIEGSSAALRFIDPAVRDRVVIHDLTKPIDAGTYDLVISTEVAEHLPKKSAADFVQSLAGNSSKTILFTAAKPGQWGEGHINCQSQEYWIGLFVAAGWQYDSLASRELTAAVKRSPLISQSMPWIVDNFMIFKR